MNELLDRIMINQIAIMNALRVATVNVTVAEDLAACMNHTIEHNPRIKAAWAKSRGEAA